MNTKLKNDSSMLIYRGAGYIWSDNAQLFDTGAHVKFEPYDSWRQELKISFGYKSESGKRYFRDMKVDMNKVIELRNFLNKQIENSTYETNDYHFINYNPLLDISEVKRKGLEVEFVSDLQLTGYKLEFLEPRWGKEALLVDIKFTDKSEDEVYCKIYKTNWKSKFIVETLFDFDESLRQYLPTKIELTSEEDDYYVDLFALEASYAFQERNLTSEEKEALIKGLNKQEYPEDYINKIKDSLNKI